jgi:hypothetical protein
VISYIDSHRDRFGVEPICDTLQFAPSTYYATKKRPPSARQQRDEVLKPEIKRVHGENYPVYGARKVWHQLHGRVIGFALRPIASPTQCPATRTRCCALNKPCPVLTKGQSYSGILCLA